MNSVLVIGLGRFGRHLSKKLSSLGNEVMIADQDEDAVAELADSVTHARICDCSDEAALRTLGIHHFDLCFVCIGSDFAASLLITSMLRDLGAKRIISKASHDMHARLLLKNGADEVVYPERDIAERMAVRTSTRNVFDYIELTDQHAIYEIPIPKEWVDKSIAQIGIRNRHRLNILAVKTGNTLQPLPDADYLFSGGEHVLALGSRNDVQKLLKKVE
ncbi:MAG: TrkA family potassium uptake protein [Clostridia bacterium]|nr:TrkA family potassium uptake protein [Clostridia bacterium]